MPVSSPFVIVLTDPERRELSRRARSVRTRADAIVIPPGVDPVVFNRMLTLARKLAVRVGPFAGGYLVNAAWDKTHEQFWQAVSFVALVLRYLSS